MARKRYTEEQIVNILKEAAAGIRPHRPACRVTRAEAGRTSLYCPLCQS